MFENDALITTDLEQSFVASAACVCDLCFCSVPPPGRCHTRALYGITQANFPEDFFASFLMCSKVAAQFAGLAATETGMPDANADADDGIHESWLEKKAEGGIGRTRI